MPGPRVLIVGLDPDVVPGVDATAVRAGLQYGLARFEDSDLIADQCLVPLDATAERRIVEALADRQYDCVVVGGGIRKPEPLLGVLRGGDQSDPAPRTPRRDCVQHRRRNQPRSGSPGHRALS